MMYHTENQKFKSSSNYDFSTESLRLVREGENSFCEWT